MMSVSYILAHDIGTSSVKSVVVEDSGKVVATASSKYICYFTGVGQVEQDPRDWWQGVVNNTKKLLDKLPNIKKKIVVIAVCGQMTSGLPVDKDGEQLHKALIHADNRAVSEKKIIDRLIGNKKIYDLTGNRLDARNTLCKILWFKNNLPEVYKNTAKFLQAKDYIVAKLTGNINCTDYSEATHGALCDIVTKKYLTEIFKCLKIESEKLPEIFKGIEKAGYLSEKSAKKLGLIQGIPVAVGCGDGSSATIGAGVVKPGEAYACLGTTAWIASLIAQPVMDEQQKTFLLTAADGENTIALGVMQAAGRSIAWIKKILGVKDYKQLESKVNSVCPGSEGLIFLPYLDGERTPIWDANAKGLFFGIDSAHKKEHFLRAVVEGIAYSLKDIYNAVNCVAKIDTLRLIGGGAKLVSLRKIMAAQLETPLLLLAGDSEEATVLGTAAVGGVAVGLYENLSSAIKYANIQNSEVPDKILSKEYKKWYALRKSLYTCLKQAYKKRSIILKNS